MSDTPITSNNDEVICPNCCHQFRAIPVNVQRELSEAKEEVERVSGLIGTFRDDLRDKNEQLARGLAEWIQAAYACGLYRADTPHNTCAEWKTAQVDAATALLDERDQLRRELTEAKAENARLWRENDANAFNVSPAMLMAKIEQLNAEIERLQRGWDNATAIADRMELERNDARAEVERLQATLDLNCEELGRVRAQERETEQDALGGVLEA